MENLSEDSRRLRDELDDLFAPANAAYRELTAAWQRRQKEIGSSKPARATYEELVTAWQRREKEVYGEIRKRFEQGESAGKYPTLSALLSQLTEAEQEEFFRTRGRQPARLSKPREQPREKEQYSDVAGSVPISSTLNERIFEELDEVFGLPERASYKHLARLWSSQELCDEAWSCFERGKDSGRFPVLSEFLSNFSNEEKETFFRTGGMQAIFPLEQRPEKPWDEEPYNGDSEWYRSDLYNGVSISGDPRDLQGLAAEYMEELAHVGYRGRVRFYDRKSGEVLSFPAKRETSSEAKPEPLRVGWKAQPVAFNEGREVLWLELDAGRSERGHKEIKLNDEPLRTDLSILASLITMVCGDVDSKELKRLSNRLDEALLREVPDLLEQPFIDRVGELNAAGFPRGYYRTLDFALMLLRHHKPYFDRLEGAERMELLGRACGHVNDFLLALRRVVAFLDHGVPGRQLRSAKGEAEKHIEAAILKQVYGLTHMEIAEEMDEPIPKKYKDSGDHETVRQWVRLGTKLLTDALSQDGWELHARRMKAEAERWNALSEGEQESEAFLEDYAESRSISLALAREDLRLLESGHPLSHLTRVQRSYLEEAREALLPEDDYLAAQERRLERALETWPPDDEHGRVVLQCSLDRAREARRTVADGRRSEDGLRPGPAATEPD